MFHHEFADGRRRPTIEEFPFLEARRTYFLQGRLYLRLCQVVGEPTMQRPEHYPESFGIEK